MTVTRVKICGITTENELEMAVSAGADAIGVITAISSDSPRRVPVARARDLVSAVPPFVTSVLVTMPDSRSHAEELLDLVDPDAIQIHGSYPASALSPLTGRTTVIRAVDSTDRDTQRVVDGQVDGVLFDSLDEAGAGGTGRAHDWEHTRQLVRELNTPVILAGGLTPTNVADAIDIVDPFAVDVASGVEGDSGKDSEKVTAFVAAAGRAGGPVIEQ